MTITNILAWVGGIGIVLAIMYVVLGKQIVRNIVGFPVLAWYAICMSGPFAVAGTLGGLLVGFMLGVWVGGR